MGNILNNVYLNILNANFLKFTFEDIKKFRFPYYILQIILKDQQLSKHCEGTERYLRGEETQQ